MKRKRFLKIFLAALSLAFLLRSATPVGAAPGDLDLSFGNGGKVTAGNGFNEKGYAVAIQPDGKIVIAGERLNTSGSHHALVTRYNPDGSIDETFGNGGVVVDAAHGGHTTYFRAVALQGDGKIVVAGYFFESGGCTGTRPWIVRYNANGSRDTTFGGDGAVEFIYNCPSDSYGYNYAVAVQSNGKIVVAGAAKNASGNLDFAAARFNSDGEPDTTFNLDGLATFPIGSGNDGAYSLAIHPTSGKIILAGYTLATATSNDFALIMLSANGLYDWGFGGGVVTTNTGGQDLAQSVAFQNDGKIIAAGRQSNGSNTTDFSVVRYNSNGSLDTSFSSDGKVVTAFSASYDAAFGIALQPDGRIVVAGYGADNNALYTGYNFALSRYNANGSLDMSFSGDGKQMTDFLSDQDHAQAVAIQTDGKIVVAGYRYIGTAYSVALARYLP